MGGGGGGGRGVSPPYGLLGNKPLPLFGIVNQALDSSVYVILENEACTFTFLNEKINISQLLAWLTGWFSVFGPTWNWH